MEFLKKLLGGSGNSPASQLGRLSGQAGKPFSARLVGNAIVTADADGQTVILRRSTMDAELPSDAEADAQMRKFGSVPSTETRKGFRYGLIVLRAAPLVGLTPEQVRPYVQRPNVSEHQSAKALFNNIPEDWNTPVYMVVFNK
jgi:hypothetical protein